jgi:hypothetical protein
MGSRRQQSRRKQHEQRGGEQVRQLQPQPMTGTATATAALTVVPEKKTWWRVDPTHWIIVILNLVAFGFCTYFQNYCFGMGYRKLGITFSALGLEVLLIILGLAIFWFKPKFVKQTSWGFAVATTLLIAIAWGQINSARTEERIFAAALEQQRVIANKANDVSLTVGTLLDDHDPFSNVLFVDIAGTNDVSKVHWNVRWNEPAGLHEYYLPVLRGTKIIEKLDKGYPNSIVIQNLHQVKSLENDTKVTVDIVYTRNDEKFERTNSFRFKVWNMGGRYAWSPDGPGETEEQIMARIRGRERATNIWQTTPFLSIKNVMFEKIDPAMNEGWPLMLTWRYEDIGGLPAYNVREVVSITAPANKAIYSSNPAHLTPFEVYPNVPYLNTNKVGGGPDFPTIEDLNSGRSSCNVLVLFDDQFHRTFGEIMQIEGVAWKFAIRYYDFTYIVPHGSSQPEFNKLLPRYQIPTND